MSEPNGNNPGTPAPDSDKPVSNPSEKIQAGTPAGAPAATVTAKPSTPTKPAPAKAPVKKGTERRFFLLAWLMSPFAVAWVAFSASMLGLTLGTVRFLFPNVLSEPPSSFNAGDANNYEENVVSDRFKDKGSWVIRARDARGRDTIYALSTVCTHLGCTPNWLESEKKFKCPCHGSGFKLSGVNFEGPAPRPLERFAVSKNENNQIIVDKSKKFQQERGEWDNPESFILLG